jgi:hypothetical protein
MPVRDQGQRRTRILFCCFRIGRASVKVGPRQTHQQLGFSPLWIERFTRCGFRFLNYVQTFQVAFDRLVLASPALGGCVPNNGPHDPKKTRVIGIAGLHFLHQ